jgi:hypothetical protein
MIDTFTDLITNIDKSIILMNFEITDINDVIIYTHNNIDNPKDIEEVVCDIYDLKTHLIHLERLDLVQYNDHTDTVRSVMKDGFLGAFMIKGQEVHIESDIFYCNDEEVYHVIAPDLETKMRTEKRKNYINTVYKKDSYSKYKNL